MFVSIFQLVLFQLILPAVFIFSLWKGSFNSKVDWMVQGILTVLFTTWLILSSPWDWFSYYWPFVWLLLLVVAIYYSWKKAKALPMLIKYKWRQKGALCFYVVLALVFGLYNVWTLSGYSTKEEGIELDFPLKDGVYYIGQGGNHVSINYHHVHPSQRYAVDVVKLNAFGLRADGIYPEQLDKYVIYGDTLYSPCSGEVIEYRNDLPDLTPPHADSKNVTGNFVNISCEKQDVNVYIAHMQEGSVTVEAGERVERGQSIGLVGNSGNTSEPHLHIHAERNGEGVPIEFDGRFLVRNSLVW